MTNKKKQTIRQYAKNSNLPLKQVLNDLKNSGFICKTDDILEQNMRKELLIYFRKRLNNQVINPRTPEKQRKRAEELKKKDEKNAERLKKKEEDRNNIINKIINNLKKTNISVYKIGHLLDICFDLIPTPLADKIFQNYIKNIFTIYSFKITDSHYINVNNINNIINNQSISFAFYILINTKMVEPISGLSIITANSTKITIPEWAIKDHNLIIGNRTFIPSCLENNNQNWNITNLSKDVKLRKKGRCYTDALVEIIYSLLNIDLTYSIDFKDFSFLGELLIEMGVIESALQLYAVDERIFNIPNMLSELTNIAIKQGDIEKSNKIINKLIEKEPYHPLIPMLKSEIKRMEQRLKLKTILSIDFSKIDELSGIEFENLLMDKFCSLGFKVELTPKVGDFGADLIVETKEGTRIIVQCKRFKSKVNLKAVQEVIGAMGHYAGDLGIVITNNSFLNSAIKLAESHDIELWDGNHLVSFLAGDLSFSKII